LGAPDEDEEIVVVGDPAPVSRPSGEAGAAEGEPAPEDVVIVAGTRSAQMAGAVQVVSEEQLERTEYDDPHAVLRQVPGVFVREEDGTGLRPNVAMRGVNPDRSKKVTLMEDGILFGPAPYSAPAAYYFPMMTRMTPARIAAGVPAIRATSA
jgi:Fe(3+) dicitrate transport protein